MSCIYWLKHGLKQSPRSSRRNPHIKFIKFIEQKKFQLFLEDWYMYYVISSYDLNLIFQTLMETCKNLLNHDIHVHLKNLTTAATKGYIPKGDSCNLCTKQFINQNETDTVIIFRLEEISSS
jgi:hypothetical protein